MSDWRHRDAQFLSPLGSWLSNFYLECLWITYSLTNSYLYTMYLDQIYHKLRPLSSIGISTFPPPHHLHNCFQMIIPAIVLSDLIGLSRVSISIATVAAGSSLLQWPCQDYSVSQHSYPFFEISFYLFFFLNVPWYFQELIKTLHLGMSTFESLVLITLTSSSLWYCCL